MCWASHKTALTAPEKYTTIHTATVGDKHASRHYQHPKASGLS